MLNSQYDAYRNVMVNATGIVDVDDDDLPATDVDTDLNNNKNRSSDHGHGEASSIASVDDDNDTMIQTSSHQMTTDIANNSRRINVITTFCQYIKANLNRMTDEQIDRVIEDMTVMLFRRKRAFRRSCDARF